MLNIEALNQSDINQVIFLFAGTLISLFCALTLVVGMDIIDKKSKN